jgi:ferredoxin-fold anticodon binding domain-containing protein
MKIPLVFFHLTKCISDTDAINLSKVNKYSYESLAGYVNLTACFTMKQLKKNIKFQVRNIRINSSDELRELLVHSSCTKIHELEFNDSMNDVIEQYPQNIKMITFGNNYNQPTNNLPASVTHVTFGLQYNQPTNNLPAAVTHVIFGVRYNQPTNNLPASVTRVTFVIVTTN